MVTKIFIGTKCAVYTRQKKKHILTSNARPFSLIGAIIYWCLFTSLSITHAKLYVSISKYKYSQYKQHTAYITFQPFRDLKEVFLIPY